MMTVQNRCIRSVKSLPLSCALQLSRMRARVRVRLLRTTRKAQDLGLTWDRRRLLAAVVVEMQDAQLAGDK